MAHSLHVGAEFGEQTVLHLVEGTEGEILSKTGRRKGVLVPCRRDQGAAGYADKSRIGRLDPASLACRQESVRQRIV